MNNRKNRTQSAKQGAPRKDDMIGLQVLKQQQGFEDTPGEETEDTRELERRLQGLDKPEFFGTQEWDESGELLDPERATTKLLRLENRLALYEGQLRSVDEPIELSGSRPEHLEIIEEMKLIIEELKDRIRADETMRHHAEKWQEGTK